MVSDPNLDFKVTIFFNAIYLRNGTYKLHGSDRKSYIIYRMVPFSMTLNDPNQDLKGMPLFDIKHFRNDTRLTRGYHRSPTDSDM